MRSKKLYFWGDIPLDNDIDPRHLLLEFSENRIIIKSCNDFMKLPPR